MQLKTTPCLYPYILFLILSLDQLTHTRIHNIDDVCECVMFHHVLGQMNSSDFTAGLHHTWRRPVAVLWPPTSPHLLQHTHTHTTLLLIQSFNTSAGYQKGLKGLSPSRPQWPPSRVVGWSSERILGHFKTGHALFHFPMFYLKTGTQTSSFSSLVEEPLSSVSGEPEGNPEKPSGSEPFFFPTLLSQITSQLNIPRIPLMGRMHPEDGQL